MASVVNRSNNQYYSSVDTTEFSDVAWLINPDITAVQNIPTQYWIVPQYGDPSNVVTADELSWKRDTNTTSITTYRDIQLSGEFHYAPNGNDLSEGALYNASSFETTILIDKVIAILSGVPVDAITASSKVSTRDIAGATLELTSSELINFHARFQRTREIVRQDYNAKQDELNAITTEEAMDLYDPYTGWRPI
jgi:hypothetical protein